MKRILHAVQVLVLAFAGTAFAQPFQNGSFEGCGGTNWFSIISGIPGWTVTAGNVDWETNTVGVGWQSSEGGCSLDLVGISGIGAVGQVFDTTGAATYQVYFDLAGNYANPPVIKPLRVGVNGVTRDYTFNTTGKSDVNMGWTTKSFAFVAPPGTSSDIFFASDLGTFPVGDAGAALDNARILQLNPWSGFQVAPIVYPGNPTTVSDGLGGNPAQFTYQTANSPCCETGTFRFETSVPLSTPTAGDVTVNYVYSGYHGTCLAAITLRAYVNGVFVTTVPGQPDPLINATDTCVSGLFPAGGFGRSGRVTFPGLAPGDVYGFEMYGTNNDSNGAIGGRLTVTYGAEATSVAIGSLPNPGSVGSPVSFTATVTGNAPTGHVTFTQELPPNTQATGREINIFPVVCRAVPLVGNTATCTVPDFFLGNRNIFAHYSGDSVNAGSVSPAFLQVTNAAPPPLAAPTLARAIAVSGGQTYLVGRSLPSSSINFNTYLVSSCNAGVVGASSPLGSFSTVATDAQGYFAVTLPGVVSGNFVSIQLTAPGASPMSNCITSARDNDSWPKAFDFGASPSLTDYIDAPGKARWYFFSITPGQKVTVSLSGLPADYDVVVFKDIYQAFVKQLLPTDATALNRLNAEFAPSTFSPSTFSPSTFSPSTFSPDAYAPSTFSPSTFSSSLFSPSTFSPSTFSPSTFSPSTFSPSTFSPSTFSPSTFSPSTFSPSTFSPSTTFQFTTSEVQQAFSSAQTGSIIGVSATPGLVNETVVVNSWNETGNFYVRIAGRGDAFSTSGQFTVSVSKGATTCTGVTPLAAFNRPAAPGTGVKTVILTDSTKVTLSTLVSGVTLLSKLQAFANRSDIAGAIVDVNLDARVSALKVQADAHKDCPYATNLVAEEIKTIVDSYRANNSGLRYVVIVGNDGAIPFFRYPDETLIGQESGYEPPVAGNTISDASLSQDFVLSQDAYGAKTRISMRSIEFPVPGLAVGRLLETPAEIAGLIDAYTAAGGVITPTSSLVTGYDFLADVAGAITAELQSGTGVAPQTLVTANGISPQDPQSWNATQLSSALLGSRHDVVFLGGHFSANSALAADFTTSLLTTDLAASSTNFTNSIVFSAGCHAGYNIVDADAIQGVTVKLDWVQAFAQKRATLVAGTGYQYGDTDFIEYSERLYKNFARQLRAGPVGTQIAVGEALVRAKLDYIAITPDIRGIHLKAVLEATVFGLPMLSVNMPAGRGAISPDAGVIAPTLVSPATSPGAQLGLRTADLPLTPSSTPGGTCLKNPPFDTGVAGTPILPCPSGYTTATWLNGPDGVVSNPAEPVLPLHVVNVTPTTTNIALRGVGFLGGAYADTPNLVPLTGAPTTEIRGVHTSFSSPFFFPMRLATTNYFAALSGMGGTRLLVTPAQHRADDLTLGTSVLRKYTGLNLRLYYSDNTTRAALSAAPTIVSVNTAPSGGVTFSARVIGDPDAAIHDVWVTYTGGTGTWASVPLTQCSSPPPSVCGTTTDTQVWMGQLASPPANLKYIVQAVNGIGLVSLDDNLGAYYSFAAVAPPPAAATTLTLNSPPTSITYGQTPGVNATLSSSSVPVGSAALSISAGGTSATATTNSSGLGTTSLAKVAPGTYQIVASYAGSASYLPSTASSPLTVNPAQSFFVDDSLTVAPAAFLVAPVGTNPQQPISQELVTFAVSQSGNLLKTFPVRTDINGRAALPPTGLPIGTYNVLASFAGSELYLGSSLAIGNLQVTTPCPLGEKTKVRWHYSANGSPGNWTSDKQISCTDGSVVFATQASEGTLNLAPGTAIKFGFALQLPGNKTHFNALINTAKAVFPVACVSGATPSQSSFTVIIPNHTLLLDSKSWNPSSQKDDPSVYQGSGTVPNLCAGGQVKLNQGGSFSAFITLN